MLWKILRHALCVIKAAHRSWYFTFTQILRIHSRYRYYFYRMLHHLLVISSRGLHSKNSRFDPQTKIYINNTGIIHLYTRGVFKYTAERSCGHLLAILSPTRYITSQFGTSNLCKAPCLTYFRYCRIFWFHEVKMDPAHNISS